MADTANIKYRVSTLNAGFMIAFALAGDLLQFLLTISVVFAITTPLVTFFVQTCLLLWFLILGVNFIGGKKSFGKIVAVLTTTIFEVIPLLGGLPTLSIMTVYIILGSRAEDRARNQS